MQIFLGNKRDENKLRIIAKPRESRVVCKPSADAEALFMQTDAAGSYPACSISAQTAKSALKKDKRTKGKPDGTKGSVAIFLKT